MHCLYLIMKILFTADWHIKLGQKNVPIEWQKNRFYLFYKDLCNIIKDKDIDLLIIGGDIFDKVPSLDELELFFNFIQIVKVETIIYSGNHEAVKKDTTFLSYLKNVVNSINSRVTIIDDYFTYKGIIDFIPYNKLKSYYPQDIDFHSSILCTHVRGNIPPHVISEVPLSLFERWEVVLAGDLHSYTNSQLNILYPGSPLTTSFHRNRVNTGVIVLDSSLLKHEWIELSHLPQLIRKTISNEKDIVKTQIDHTIYEIEGSITDISKIKNSELLDKKIIKKVNDVELILDPKMTIVEELNEYLSYILNLEENKIKGIIKYYLDNVEVKIKNDNI